MLDFQNLAFGKFQAKNIRVGTHNALLSEPTELGFGTHQELKLFL